MSGSKPMSRQRSAWVEMTPVPAGTMRIAGQVAARWFARSVGDGTLRACVAIEDPIGWHMSISFVDRRGEPTRYPRWDEITHAREQLLPHDLGFVMHLPPLEEYVALHDTTFHLHQHPEPS